MEYIIRFSPSFKICDITKSMSSWVCSIRANTSTKTTANENSLHLSLRPRPRSMISTVWCALCITIILQRTFHPESSIVNHLTSAFLMSRATVGEKREFALSFVCILSSNSDAGDSLFCAEDVWAFMGSEFGAVLFLGNGVPSPCGGSKEDSEVFGEVKKCAGLSQSFQMRLTS